MIINCKPEYKLHAGMTKDSYSEVFTADNPYEFWSSRDNKPASGYYTDIFSLQPMDYTFHSGRSPCWKYYKKTITN